MDKLDLAVRRYKQILPEPVGYVPPPKLAHLKVWLADDVCPVVEDYACRAPFREHATWAIRMIAPGARTRERQEIDAVDQALVDCARALSSLASKSRVQKQLGLMDPPGQYVVGGDMAIAGCGTRRLARKQSVIDTLSIELAQVDAIKRRPWKDLVNVGDYFEPQQEFVQTGNGQLTQRGEFIVSLNPKLHPVGNFIVRCMFLRLDGMLETLSAARAKLMHAVEAIGQPYRDVAQVNEAWKTVLEGHAALQKTHTRGPNNRLRDSCMILTQVYATFAPSPDLGWLSISRERIEGAVESLRYRITNFQNVEMFDRIAAALGDLGRLYEGQSPNQSAKDEAIAGGGLVLDEQAFAVSWDRQAVGVEWGQFPKLWTFLCALARKAGHQGDVTESDVYGNQVVSRTTMATNAERLKQLLPPALRKRIVPGRKPRTYRLDLAAHLVHVFDNQSG